MRIVNRLSNKFTVRAPRMEDVEAVNELVSVVDLAEEGESDATVEDLRAEWQTPGLNLATDAWLVVAPGERFVGYGVLTNTVGVRFRADGYVHPDYLGQGIGTLLVRATEQRARQQVPQAPPGAQVAIYNGIITANQAANRLMEQEGYQLARHFWRMQIDMLNGAPPAPEWPVGVAVRTFAPGQDDRTTFDAMEDAFRDHWGYLPWRYDVWHHRMMEREDFEPDLWFLAVDGDQVTGGALCYAHPNNGWVSQLGVRRPWRRMGLGLALLNHAFGEFYRRGQRRVDLGVDSQNPTGATRLYQRAGMHIARQFSSYQKVLRAGEELSVAA